MLKKAWLGCTIISYYKGLCIYEAAEQLLLFGYSSIAESCKENNEESLE